MTLTSSWALLPASNSTAALCVIRATLADRTHDFCSRAAVIFPTQELHPIPEIDSDALKMLLAPETD